MLFGGAAAAALVDLFYGPKEMCKVIRCDSFSELPGIHLGTSWTVRSAMLMCKEGGKRKKNCSVLTHHR